MELGKKISQYRKSLGVSQEELGARLGVSRQAVSKWETGAATPDMVNLIALAKEFGISVAELTETAEEPPRQSVKKEIHSWTWISTLCALLGLAAIALFFLSGNRAPASPPMNSPLPETEFYLYWRIYSDGSHTKEALALGTQETAFPFGTSLEPTAPEEVYDTDFAGMMHHKVICGGVTVEYNHIEDEEGARDIVTSLSTITSSFATPRGMIPGETKDDLVLTYNDLVYCLKETNGYTLVPHDEYYVYSAFEENLGWASILFYMKDGLVAGLRLELMQDAGDAYAPDNISRFPVKDGEPDFSARQEPDREELSDTRRVYIALNQLVTNSNLSAEERYAYRRDVFTLLPDLDWSELRSMGTAEYPDDAIFALLDWLRGQDGYSPSEILRIQMGCTAKGLDGAYTDGYCGILSHAFFCDPINFSKSLAADGASEGTRLHAIRFTAYDAELYPMELQAALDILDEAMSGETFTEAEAGWARLLRLYLITPMDERNQLPKTPLP